jgi:hypothetical protein
MTRSLGMVFLLISLAVGGYLFSQQAKTSGPTSTLAQQAETQASVDAAATNFAGAVPTLQAWFADHGTYAGASIPASFGVVLVRGDATSYCLQTTDGQSHEVGPSGAPAAGPC